MIKRRNPLGNLAILGKGGAHVRTNAAKRASNKRALGSELDDWYEETKERGNEGLDGKAIEPLRLGREFTNVSVSLSTFLGYARAENWGL